MTEEQMWDFCERVQKSAHRRGFDPLDVLMCLTNNLVLLIGTHPEPATRQALAETVIELLRANYAPPDADPDATRH